MQVSQRVAHRLLHSDFVGFHLLGDRFRHPNLDVVVVDFLEFHGIGLAVFGFGGQAETLGFLAVRHRDGGIGQQREFFLKSLRVFRQGFLLLFGLFVGIGVASGGNGLGTRLFFLFLLLFSLSTGFFAVFLLLVELRFRFFLAETVIGLFQERNLVVESLQTERTVEVERAVVGNDVAERSAVFEVGSAHPIIGRVEGNIACHPVENRDKVERQLIGRLERLIVVERRSEVAQRRFHRVFPRLVAVGVEVFVDDGVRFLDFGVGGALEVHMKVFREVPANREIAVPQELLAERRVEFRAAEVFHIALLQFVVVAQDFGVERDALWQPVQPESLENLVPFRLRLDVLKRFERLEHGCPRIIHTTSPVVLVFVDGRFALRVAIGMAVVEREVRGVDGGRMALVLNAHAHVREREIAVGRARHGYRLDAVALVLVGSGIERVVEAHIGVKRIVFRARFLFRNRIVERCRHFRLFGEKFAEFDRCRDAVGLVIVFRPRGNALFQAAEALGSVSTLHIHRAEVGKLHI